MKFTVKKEYILKSLQLVSGAVEKRQTLPILSNVLLVVKDNQLMITATDLEVELLGRVELDEVEEIGEITVTAKKLIDICKTLPNDADVTLITEKNRVVLKSGKSKFLLSSLPADEFPNVEVDDKTGVTFNLAQKTLKKMLENTYFAMAQQDVRYYLNSMLIHIDGENLKLIATDGHRLSLASLSNLKLEPKRNLQVIVPRKGIMELLRLLNEEDKDISITFGTNHIFAITSDFTLISKLIEGKFPDYHKAIPRNSDKRAIINREALRLMLSRVSVLSNEKFRGVRLLFSLGVLKVYANNPEQEEAEDELAIEYQGPDLEMGFNVNYLLDVCNTITDENVALTFFDADSSILIENNQYLHVIMPMRL